jgi:hypothetical protein
MLFFWQTSQVIWRWTTPLFLAFLLFMDELELDNSSVTSFLIWVMIEGRINFNLFSMDYPMLFSLEAFNKISDASFTKLSFFIKVSISLTSSSSDSIWIC